jgi:hypothetical protein
MLLFEKKDKKFPKALGCDKRQDKLWIFQFLNISARPN